MYYTLKGGLGFTLNVSRIFDLLELLLPTKNYASAYISLLQSDVSGLQLPRMNAVGILEAECFSPKHSRNK